VKRKAQFCYDMKDNHYGTQGGGAMPVFAGTKRHRGHGICSMLIGLFRNVVLPFLKANLSSLDGNVLKTGVQALDDVVWGNSLKDTVKSE